MIISIISTFFFSVLLTSSFMVLLLPNPIHSLLFLIIIFINSAGILLTFNVEFLALLLIIIYVGAIAILFLFMLMMIDIKISLSLKTDWFVYFFLCSVLTLLFFFELYNNVYTFLVSTLYNLTIFKNPWVNIITEINNCATFGQVLYSFYLIFFLIAGLILLIALIGAIVLTQSQKIKKKRDFHQLSRNNKINLIN